MNKCVHIKLFSMMVKLDKQGEHLNTFAPVLNTRY